MTVKFKCTLQGGEVVVGPIMGNGGYLGASCSHLSKQRQREAAAKILSVVRARLNNDGEQRRIYEAEPGCCAVYPNDCAETHSEPVAVPILGTKFEIQED
jgi:hypothetical protein